MDAADRIACPHCGSSTAVLIEGGGAVPALYWCRRCWVPWTAPGGAASNRLPPRGASLNGNPVT